MHDLNALHGERQKAESGLTADTEQSRRDFLKKAGKFAVYTPPAIMLMMQPSRNAIAYSGRGYKGHRGHSHHVDKLKDHVRHRPGHQQMQNRLRELVRAIKAVIITWT